MIKSSILVFFPAFLFFLTLQAVGQNKVWNDVFPYPSDFPPLEDTRVYVNDMPGGSFSAFKSKFYPDGLNGSNYVEYVYQQYAPTPDVIVRSEKRTEYVKHITMGTWWRNKLSGFTETHTTTSPNINAPMGYQGLRKGIHLESYDVIKHSYTIGTSLLTFEENQNTAFISRSYDVEDTAIVVTFESSLKQVPNDGPGISFPCSEKVTVSFFWDDNYWIAARKLEIPFFPDMTAVDSDQWPTSGGGSQTIPAFIYSGPLQLSHVYGSGYLNPPGASFYAFNATTDIPWNQEPFF